MTVGELEKVLRKIKDKKLQVYVCDPWCWRGIVSSARYHDKTDKKIRYHDDHPERFISLETEGDVV